MRVFAPYPLLDAAHLSAAPLLATTAMAARLIAGTAPLPWSPAALTLAQLEAIERSFRRYQDPGFNLKLASGARPEEIELSEDPWARLTRFPKTGGTPVLIIAPSSGHHPTLLRQTAAVLRETHDVAVAGWRCASHVPLSVGPLGLDAMLDRILDAVRLYREETGRGDVHMLAVCQPAPLALAAAVLLEEAGLPLASLTLMGGPIDPAAAPTTVSRYANSHPLRWFERHAIDTVPLGRPGYGRRVYPGFKQLASFIAMNPERHAEAFAKRFMAAWARDQDAVARSDAFYDDYFAVADLPAEFYLETLERVFRRRDLARGAWRHHGNLVDPRRLEKTPLMVIEGELDDICAPGQTAAALDLTARLRPGLKRRLVASGVGHYGLFSGSRWRKTIAPELRAFIREFTRSS